MKFHFYSKRPRVYVCLYSYCDQESPPRHTPMRGELLKSARAVAMAQVERIIQVQATVLYPMIV